MFVSSSLIKSEGRSCFACLSESMGLATCHYLYIQTDHLGRSFRHKNYFYKMYTGVIYVGVRSQ